MSVLVAYATRHGATAGIASRVAAALTAAGLPAEARPVEDVRTSSRTRRLSSAVRRRPAMDTFDRARPLWELTLVEDLQDGRAALIAKVHHSLSDGISGMHLLAAIADQKRKPRRLGEMPPAPPGEKVKPRPLATDAAGVIIAQLTRLARRGAGAAMPTLIRSVR